MLETIGNTPLVRLRKIVPADSRVKRIDWPDFAGRARDIVKKQKGKPASRVVIEDRQTHLAQRIDLEIVAIG